MREHVYDVIGAFATRGVGGTKTPCYSKQIIFCIHNAAVAV